MITGYSKEMKKGTCKGKRRRVRGKGKEKGNFFLLIIPYFSIESIMGTCKGQILGS